MKRNVEVIEAFLAGNEAHNKNLKTDGKELINYATVIAFHERDKVVVSSTKYSQTTSTIQNKIKSLVPENMLELRELGWDKTKA